MNRRVLIGPAQLRTVPELYAPALAPVGAELVYPLKPQQLTEPELMAQLPGCSASLAGSEPYTREVIAAAAAKGLKVIARAGVGYDGVDLPAATDHGVAVTFAPGTNQDAVAEHTFMLILALLKNLIPQHTGARAGKWIRTPTLPLRGQTLGVVGLGRIGKAVSLRGLAFGTKVIAHDPFGDAQFAAQHGIPLMPLDDVLREADILTLHMPMTAESKQFINARSIGLMKPTAFVINTARGGVINEPDLYEALKSKRLAGAGLDVMDEEPPPADHPLLTLDNVALTAHTAGIDRKGVADMATLAATAIAKLLAGEWPADWVVNPAVKDKFFSR